MLKKFTTIRNVGKFRNCSAAGDIEFRKLSLVYAENGRGKTMLCAILRSLQNGDPLFITERRKLAARPLRRSQPPRTLKAGDHKAIPMSGHAKPASDDRHDFKNS